MKYSTKYTIAVIAFGYLLNPAIASAQGDSDGVLFKEDFSGEVSDNPNPRWSWNVQASGRDGMMLGEDDIYQVVENEHFLSHRRSLRMNFSGRNNHCNTCGGDYLEIEDISNGKACAAINDDTHEDYIFNLDNNFSKWTIDQSSSDSQRICVSTASAAKMGINGTAPSVSVGDKIFLPKVCGVNGTVGGNVNRRSDCNKAINYLSGTSSNDIGYGETLSRRFYVYIPKETELPATTFKLGYAKWRRPDGSLNTSTLKISVQRNSTLELSLPNDDTYLRSLSSADAFTIPRDTWIYFEEVFTRETSDSSNDASYILYVSPIDQYTDSPIVRVSDFTLGALNRISVGGNWQHYNDVSGYVYFDNILFSKERAGPVHRPIINGQ